MKVLVSCVLSAGVLALCGCPQVGLQCNKTDVVCAQQCANIQGDPQHCGGCGNQCATGFSCVNGACTCPYGLTQCGQTCVSLNVSSANCGSCGAACPSNLLCQSGSCVASCSAGTMACGQSCVNPLTDNTLCGCGIDGGTGTMCTQGTVCRSGKCTSDLYAACYNSGEVVGIDAADEIVSPNPTTNPPVNPAALALTSGGDLEVVDTGRVQLETFAIGTSPLTLLSEDATGQGASSVTVVGSLAYVVNSSDCTLDVLNLAAPAGSRLVCSSGGGSAAAYPDGGCPASAVFTADSYPETSAVAPDGTVFVTIQGDVKAQDAGPGAPGNQVATVNAHTYAVTYTPITGNLEATGTQARPFGALIANGYLYVSLQNLNGYLASGPGLVDAFQLITTPDAGTSLGSQQIIPLGPGCLNAGGMTVVGSMLFVTCGPQYGMNSSGDYVPQVPGALAGINLTTNQAAFQPQVLSCPSMGGSCEAGGPTQITYAGGKLFMTDSFQGRLFTADPMTGNILRGPQNPLNICSGPLSGSGELTSAVVGLP